MLLPLSLYQLFFISLLPNLDVPKEFCLDKMQMALQWVPEPPFSSLMDGLPTSQSHRHLSFIQPLTPALPDAFSFPVDRTHIPTVTCLEVTLESSSSFSHIKSCGFYLYRVSQILPLCFTTSIAQLGPSLTVTQQPLFPFPAQSWT